MTTPDGTPRYPLVTVVKQKLGGSRACWRAWQLADDADGLWLYTPAGSRFRSSNGRTDDVGEVEGGTGPGLDSLILVPAADRNWLATWRVPERSVHISIEICDWIRRDDRVIAFLDWELDPFRLRSGLVAVEDLDDFAESRASGLLSPDDAERALAAAAWTERNLRSGGAPFDERGDRRLEEAGRLAVPPLLEVPHPFAVELPVS